MLDLVRIKISIAVLEELKLLLLLLVIEGGRIAIGLPNDQGTGGHERRWGGGREESERRVEGKGRKEIE